MQLFLLVPKSSFETNGTPYTKEVGGICMWAFRSSAKRGNSPPKGYARNDCADPRKGEGGGYSYLIFIVAVTTNMVAGRALP